MLGNLEIERKSQNRVGALANNQPPLQKLNFGNGTQKLRKSRYQSFLALTNFTIVSPIVVVV